MKTIATSVMLGVCCGAIGEEPLGRLFFTPQERAAFQAARQAEYMPPVPEIVELEPEITIEPVDIVEPEPPPAVTVDGYVRRSNGRATMWINGQNNYDGDLSASNIEPKSVRLAGRKVKLKQTGTGQSVQLKPGQSYDPGSNATTDAYEIPWVDDEVFEP